MPFQRTCGLLKRKKNFPTGSWTSVNAKERDANLPEIFYPEVQDLIAKLYNNIDFRDVTPKQLRDRAILDVTNDISLTLNNEVLNVLPGDEGD